MRDFLRKIDLIIIVIIALVAITLTVLDFFDFTTSINPNYPLFTMFLLSLVGLHLILSYLFIEDFQKDTSKSLINLTQGITNIDFQKFSNSAEIETYLAKRILEARNSIRDLSWKSKISEGFSAKNRQLAHTYMDNCIAEVSDRIPYKEIFVFNDVRRIDKLERRIDEKKKGYSCKYFKNDDNIPRIQFVIIDEEEILFFASSADSILCSFKNTELVMVFKSYFEAAWSQATVIKDGEYINTKELTYIFEKREKMLKGN